MSIQPVYGLPGVKATRTASHRTVLRQGDFTYLAQGKVIDGSLSRDPLNTGDINVLRPGVLMGMVTATGKFRPAIIGLSTVAYVDNDTTITVSAATATEIGRLKTVGGGGDLSLNFIGPPSAAGTVAVTAITVTAVGATTITVGDLNLAKVTGSLIAPVGGAHVPLTLVPDGWGIKVTDEDDANIDVEFPLVPVAGVLDTSQLINWPADTSTRQWIIDQINALAGGKFVFDHLYQV